MIEEQTLAVPSPSVLSYFFTHHTTLEDITTPTRDTLPDTLPPLPNYFQKWMDMQIIVCESFDLHLHLPPETDPFSNLVV